MVLTNMLPNQGNGTYLFSMHAQDRDGHTTLLGTRTMTCANASATKPFGAIDTPTQGGLASGASFVNFGWALTPQPKTDSDRRVDDHACWWMATRSGPVDYNHERPDIEALFPGYQNTAGRTAPSGSAILDTTTLTNGLHTISWTVTDNQGATEGIGSRFFTVSNGAGALTAAVRAQRRASLRPRCGGGSCDRRCAAGRRAVVGRRGWDLVGAVAVRLAPDASGRVVIRSEEVNRVELALGDTRARATRGTCARAKGWRRCRSGRSWTRRRACSRGRRASGSSGAYDLVFVRWDGARAVARHEVRVILAPKGSGARRPAGRDRRAAVAAGRGAAVRARRVGGGSERGDGHRRSRRCTRGRIRWRADRRCSSARRATAARGRMSRRCTAKSSATRASGSSCRGLRTVTTTSRCSRGAPSVADFVPARTGNG